MIIHDDLVCALIFIFQIALCLSKAKINFENEINFKISQFFVMNILLLLKEYGLRQVFLLHFYDSFSHYVRVYGVTDRTVIVTG